MDESAQPPIRTTVDAPVGVITLDRPRRRNPLSSATMAAITAALTDLGADPDVRVIVIRATGSVFSAGHDLTELVDRTVEDERQVFATCAELMAAIHACARPVIAEVAGAAFAAGCQLVAACDLAFASTAASFATPGVRIGLFCSTPMVELTRAIGRKRSMYMLLTGEPIDADIAAQWGLITAVVEPDRLGAHVDELARQIAGYSTATLAIGKHAFHQQIDESLSDAYELMSETMADNAVRVDAQEGMSAFLAKRRPLWSDR